MVNTLHIKFIKEMNWKNIYLNKIHFSIHITICGNDTCQYRSGTIFIILKLKDKGKQQ